MSDSVPKPPTLPAGTPQSSQPPSQPSRAAFVLVAVMFAGMWWWQLHAHQVSEEPSIPYSTFFAKLNEGVVEAVTLRGQNVEGKFSKPQQISTCAVSESRITDPPWTAWSAHL